MAEEVESGESSQSAARRVPARLERRLATSLRVLRGQHRSTAWSRRNGRLTRCATHGIPYPSQEEPPPGFAEARRPTTTSIVTRSKPSGRRRPRGREPLAVRPRRTAPAGSREPRRTGRPGSTRPWSPGPCSCRTRDLCWPRRPSRDVDDRAELRRVSLEPKRSRAVTMPSCWAFRGSARLGGVDAESTPSPRSTTRLPEIACSLAEQIDVRRRAHPGRRSPRPHAS